MLRYQVTIPQWLELPHEIRQKLIQIFNIPRSVGCQVVDSRVVSDGHTHEDLAHLSIEKMQDYLGETETDFWKLYEKTLQSVFDARQKEIQAEIEVERVKREEEAASKMNMITELAKQMSSLTQTPVQAAPLVDAVSSTQIPSPTTEEAPKRRGRPPKAM